MENLHVSEAFKIISSSSEYDIFSFLGKDEYKLIRKRIIECVLATDMTLHTKELTYLKLKVETYNIKNGNNTDKILQNLEALPTYTTQQEFLNTLMHVADISNPTKPFHVYTKWVDLVMAEFWNQGDKERELGLQISFLCDRNNTKIPAAQIGFMDGIVLPLLQIVIELFPNLSFLVDNINSNKAEYKKIKEEEEKNSDISK